MTDDEKKVVPEAIAQAVYEYVGSEENMRYICGEQFNRDWAAMETRLEREICTDAEAAAMLNNMPVDAFRYFYAEYLAEAASRLRLTDAVPPPSAVN